MDNDYKLWQWNWYIHIQIIIIHHNQPNTRFLSPTSFWPREALMQVKDDSLYKVLNVTMLRSSYEYHPIVGKTFHRGLLPHLGSMPKLQFHLNSTLERESERDNNEQERKTRIPLVDFSFLWNEQQRKEDTQRKQLLKVDGKPSLSP